MSFNTLGLLDAITEEGAARIEGTDDKDFGQRVEEGRARVREQTNLLGELIGGVAQGPGRWLFEGAEQGVRRLPGLVGRATRARGPLGLATRAGAAASVGGSTTLLYSMAGGSSLQDASEDAIYV
jgi:hypothetical protein